MRSLLSAVWAQDHVRCGTEIDEIALRHDHSPEGDTEELIERSVPERMPLSD
jgi:hypothetical protein